MTTAIEKNGHAAIDTYGFDRDKIDLIKKTIAPGTTDAELQLFLYTAQRCGLDPLARQIYCIKRGNKATIQTSIDGYRLIADRTGNYAPGRAPTFEEGEQGIIAATAYIWKYVRNTWHEVAATAYWDEYVEVYDGRPARMWANKPRVMLAKCAEALALRRAFPAELSGLYTQDEMANADMLPTEPERRPLTASPPPPRVLTKDPERERKALWLRLDATVKDAKAKGVKSQDAEQALMDGTASNEEIIALGKALRDAIDTLEEQEDERGEFTEVDDAELFPNGAPA